MAYRVANGSGNFNSASTWDQVTNTPTLAVATNLTNNSSTGLFTATFTAPNTTNQSTGVAIFTTGITSGVTMTATLQEDINGTGSWVDTAGTSGAIPVQNFGLSTGQVFEVRQGWMYYRWTTPYTFATTGAGRYRVKLKTSSATGVLAADAGLLNPMYLHTDNRNVAPSAGEDCFILSPNGSTAITVTVDGTAGAIGDGADQQTGAVPNTRSLGNALIVGGSGTSNNAILQWDTTANSTLTVKGSVLFIAGGQWIMNGAANSAITQQLIQNPGVATSGAYTVKNYEGSNAQITGAPWPDTTNWKTTYASGAGTAASPLLTNTAVNWQVGDEIIIAASSNDATNYNETESRFIIAVNSTTSFVVSSTKGGAETALTFTHFANTWIVNVTRNVILGNNDITRGWAYVNNTVNVGDVVFSWWRHEGIGSSTSANKTGFTFYQSGSSNRGQFDYGVAYKPLAAGFSIVNNKTALTYNGLVAVFQQVTLNNTSLAGILISSSGGFNKTFNNFFALGNAVVGYLVAAASGATFNNCIAIGNNSTTNLGAANWQFGAIGPVTFNNCESHCTRQYGIYSNGPLSLYFLNFLSGTMGTNVADIAVAGLTGVQAVFQNGNFGSASLFASGGLSMTSSIPGSYVNFQNLNQTTNNHRWYTTYGIGNSTGSGLSDTTVYTSGSLGVRIDPLSSSPGFNWQFQIPAAPGIINFYGFAQRITTANTCKFELFLPGNDPNSGTADASYTMSGTLGTWEAITMAANYAGTVPLLATIKVTAIGTTGSLYVDTLYNADTTQKLTGLDIWYNGQPASIILPTAVSAADIWTFNTSQLTTAGTTGKKIMDNLTTGKFLGLK